MRIRPALDTDAEAIRAIYNLEVVSSEITTFDLVPRTSDEQKAWLERHQGAHPAIVAVGGNRAPTGDGVVLGFGALSTYRTRPAYGTTV
jgi:L-amino acid N-acyltransferase YncA